MSEEQIIPEEKFLDIDGLSYFWSGVKFYVDEQPGFYHHVATITERDAYKAQVGFMVYVEETDTTYQFTKEGWREIKGNGNGGGNYLIVTTLTERDALTPTLGLMVYVTDEDLTYQYTSSGWNEFKGSGSGTTQVPVLSYTDEFPEGKKISCNKGSNVIITVRFTSQTYGNCTIDVYKDNINIKTITSPKGTISIDLGKITAEGTYNYRISGRDKLDIPADDIYFTVVCGGITLTSDFETVSASTIYEDGDVVNVGYAVKCSDDTADVKVKCIMTQNGGQYIPTVAGSTTDSNGVVIDTGVNTVTSSFDITSLPIGKYIMKLVAYTGTDENDTSEGNYVSTVVTNDFMVIAQGGIAISSTFDTSSIDNYTNINIPFKMVRKNTTRLVMKGEVLKDGVVVKSTDGITAQVNITSYWFVGKLSAGTYTYSLTAYTEDFVNKSEPVTGTLEVQQGTSTKADYVKTNCVAYFNANSMSNNDNDHDTWTNEVKAYPQYAIKLHDLNYNTNGWMLTDESDPSSEKYLKLNGESWGELINKNIAQDSDGNYTNINILEGFNSSTEGCALEVLFRTRCVGELDYRAVTCQNGINLASPGFSITQDSLYIASNDKNTYLGFSEDEWTHVVFVIDRVVRTTDDVGGLSKIENINPINTMRIYINGVLCSCEAAISDTFVDNLGKAYPLYLNTAVNSTTGKKDYFGECEIKMMRIYNSYLTSEQVLQNYIASKYDLEEQQTLSDKNNVNMNTTLPVVTFKRKKSVTTPYSDIKQNHTTFSFLNTITDKATSKTACVDCVVEIKYPDGNIDTLGNVDVYLQGTSSLQYPVKNYKLKIFQDEAHATKKKVKIQGYDDWQPESTFTLKCDYMESSHLNNTPLAGLFNTLVDELGAQSPAKFYNTIKGTNYRDAVAGFPVIVYFTDDEDDSSQLTLVGSYMFNIDKSGDTLGFKVPVYERDGNGSFLKDNPLTFQGNAIVDDEGNPVLDDEGNPTYETLKNVAQSYEETSNTSYSAGCFYSLSDYVQTEYDKYVETCNNNGETPKTLEEFSKDYNDIDYVMGDFECRYDYAEDDGDDEKSYRAMANVVEGVAQAEKDDDFKTYFEAHFDKNYAIIYYLQMMVFGQVDNAGKNSMWDTWDGEFFYVRPYDMDTSTGLSNSGTETISVDAEILRDNSPYTSDSSLYSTNANAELRYRMYNTQTSKMWNQFAKVYQDEIRNTYQKLRPTIYNMDYLLAHFTSYTTDVIGEIYYNKDMAAKYLTQTDNQTQEYLKMLHGNRIQRWKQWMKQRLDFCDSLFEYTTTYTTDDNINSTIALRSDVFNTTQTAVQAYIGIETYTPQYITINVGSGRDYIITAYVGPNSTYTDPYTGATVNGTLFSFKVRASDKEITINGAGGIKDIHYLNDLDVRDLTIDNATKLLELNIGASTRMTKLSMGNNKYLRTLNLANAKNLGTASGGSGLNLTGCSSLKTLDVSNTQLLSVTFASGSPLKEANFSGTPITSLSFNNMEFLESVNVDNCTDIDSYIFNGCSSITNLSIAGSDIRKLELVDCLGLTTLDISYCNNLQSLNVTGCDNIEEVNCKGITGTVAEDLQLYTMYNLKKLDIDNSVVKNVKLPKYASSSIAQQVASGELTDAKAEKYNKLTWINAYNSSLEGIQYGSSNVDEEDRVVDLSQLSELSYAYFFNCANIKKVVGINYSANSINGLFQSCSKLESVTGTIECTGNKANSVFYGCSALTDISGLTFKMDNVKDVSNFFAGCSLAFDSLKNLLDSCGDTLTTIDNVFMNNIGNSSAPSDLFDNTPNITSAKSAFSGVANVNFLPKDFLNKLTKLTDASSMFYNCPNLSIIYTEIFSTNTELTTLESAFEGCYSLSMSNGLCNAFEGIFANNKKLTNLKRCFYGCAKFKVKNKELGNFLNGLTSLKDTSYMFYGCTQLSGTIQDGMFAGLTSLVNAQGMFGSCYGDGGLVLPTSLVRASTSSTNNISITNIAGMFAGCKNMTGTISEHLFDGMPKLTNAGYLNEGGAYPELIGMFANTSITGYYENIFDNLPLLTNVKGFFRGCTSLTECYDSTGKLIGNTVSANLFKNNSKLITCADMFYGCTSAVGCIPLMFANCKSSLQDVSRMFMNCTSMDGIDKITDTFAGLNADTFKDCVSLTNCSNFMAGCSAYTMYVPEGLFSGCTSLYNVSSMFKDCVGLISRTAMAIPVTLFDDCRNTLAYATAMFSGCENLNGELPTVISGGSATKGFFEDCVNLVNIDNLFYGCMSVTGGIPSDMLAMSDDNSKFTSLKSLTNVFSQCISLDTGYEEDDEIYICSPTFLEKAANLTNVSSLFESVGIKNCLLPAKLFDKQTSLENVSSCFHNSGIVGSIPEGFLSKSVGSLTNAKYLFSNTSITSVPTYFLKMSASVPNTKLKYVAGIFANCTKVSGNAPAFWDKTQYTKIDATTDGYQSAFLNAKFDNVYDSNGNIIITPASWAQ